MKKQQKIITESEENATPRAGLFTKQILGTTALLILSLCIVFSENIVKCYSKYKRKHKASTEASTEPQDVSADNTTEAAANVSVDGSAAAIAAAVKEAPKQKSFTFNDLKQYRKFIASFANMIEKFQNNTDYSTELNIIMNGKIEYPVKIKDMLYDFEIYCINNLKDHTYQEYDAVNIDGNMVKRLLSKIVKVEKKNQEYSELESKKKPLEQHLVHLKDFFYSEKFLEAAFKHD